MSGTSNDDEAWQAIVDNYGERPAAEDLPVPVAEPEPPPELLVAPDDQADPDPDAFVPPEPPPGPPLDLPRQLPWVAVFGVPALLLVSLLAGVSLPTWLGYLLISSFVGSFVYLVFTMKPGGRDPFDDGARL